MTRSPTRAGFTLVEMLVALAIMIGLMGLAVIVFPGARDQDQVRTAIGDVASNLKLAQAMAARDKAPRGIRFLLNTDPNVPPNERFYSTEMQYIELPAPIVPNRTPLVIPSGPGGSTWNPDRDARVRFEYTVVPYTVTPPLPPPNPQPGTITNRRCIIQNLTLEQTTQIREMVGGTLVMPVLGAWSKIIPMPPPSPPMPPPVPVAGTTPQLYNQQINLEVFPDAVLGASTTAQTNHFAVYAALPGSGAGGGTPSGATPLVGEPTVLLPSGACIDLSRGNPNFTGTGPWVGSLPGLTNPPSPPPYFDVIFGPDGKVIGDYGGQIFLWVHGTNKFPTNIQSAPQGPQLADAYRRAGDQFFLMIRASGVISRAEVTQPDAGGNWSGGSTPFDIARRSGQ